MRIFREIKAIIAHLIIHYPETKFGLKMRKKYWLHVHKKNIGQNCHISRGAKIGLPNMIEIGDNFLIGEYATLAAGDSKPLYIGKDVSIAKNAYIRTANHEIKNRDIPISKQGHNYQIVEFNNKEYSIVIEDDVWIAANAVILSGAHIGKGSIIGAGAVVSSRIPDFSIALGNPARVIGKR